MVKYSPKDFEIYVAVTDGTYDPTTKGNDVSLGEQFDVAVTAGTVLTVFKKLSSTNSITIDPVEDDVTNKNYLGSTSTGAQNSDVFTTDNADVDIALNADPAIIEELTPYILADQGDTHSDYANYAYFNLGSKTTDQVVLLVRIYKKVGSNYYYKNYVVTEPVFKKVDNLDISGDDEVASAEYNLTGAKVLTDKDFYSGTSKETVSNLDN